MPLNVDVVPESTYTAERQEYARRLWWGLFSGPLIYALYFISGYLLAEATCAQNLFGIGPARLAPALGILTGIAAFATLLMSWLSYGLRHHLHPRDDALGDALAFMALGGLLLNGLFTLLIVVTGVSIFFIDSCQWI